jgi:hypothetical protein
MSLSPDRTFISYSRSDGRDFAESFEHRLESEEIKSWRDIKDMSSGDILPQVLKAINQCTHFVLILSRRALALRLDKARMVTRAIDGKKGEPGAGRPEYQEERSAAVDSPRGTLRYR